MLLKVMIVLEIFFAVYKTSPVLLWITKKYRSPHGERYFDVGDGGSPDKFLCNRHAAPKNSPLGCFFNGCFDYRKNKKAHACRCVL